MQHISLFSGLGGFDLAAEWIGWKNIVSCEINPFCKKILTHYWPDAYHHDDIKTLTYEKINEELSNKFGTHWRTDDIILTGGFPCQGFSTAGKRKGTEDERYLWPEMLRAIGEIRPRWIVAENVYGLLSWDGGMVFNQVQSDLETEGYQVWPFLLPACSVNAPHRRERIWFVAYSNDNRKRTPGHSPTDEGSKPPSLHKKGQKRNKQAIFDSGLCDLQGDVTDTDTTRRRQGDKEMERRSSEQSDSIRLQQNVFTTIPDWIHFPTQSPVCSRNDGLSTNLDGITFPKWRTESIKAYGNAIVPAVALQIFKAIEQYEQLN